jgi:aerobic-type carbon monoxide dehydrogenase small subunit (CoxS/CutS family)/carbon monoxide dehydrogenase subunit G
VRVALQLNGQPVELECRSDEMLLDVLRREAGLTSVRETCRIGVCGACTVLVDDEPISGCLILAAQVAGRRITTVDGLSESDRTVRAFVDNHAFQCGYCTPGFVLTARALIETHPRPNEDEIAEALAGNLCRCGSYKKILAAVQQAAADRPPTPRRSAMKLQNVFTVPAPIDRAWEILLDIERIVPCVPGATLNSRDGDLYSGEMKLKLGPMLSTFAGSLQQQEVDVAMRRTIMIARAQAERGQGRANATVTSLLAPEGDGTRVTVETDLNVTGPLAQFGRGVMQDVSAKLMDEFAACLAGELTADSNVAPRAETSVAPSAEVLDLGAAGRSAVVKRALPIGTALAVVGFVVWRRRRG